MNYFDGSNKCYNYEISKLSPNFLNSIYKAESRTYRISRIPLPEWRDQRHDLLDAFQDRQENIDGEDQSSQATLSPPADSCLQNFQGDKCVKKQKKSRLELWELGYGRWKTLD